MIPAGGLGPSVSADFSYSKSSYHQDEADPTPTITGTAGGSFNADAGVVFVDTGTYNSSTGQIDLSASTIDSHIITYTVDGVQSGQTIGITPSPYLDNTYSMQFDGINDAVIITDSSIVNTSFQSIGNENSYSISAWVNTTSTINTGFTTWYTDFTFTELRTQTSSGTHCPFYLGMDNGKIFFGRTPNHTSSDERFLSTGTINDGNWKHIVVTINVNALSMYINGSLDSSHTFTTATGDCSVGTTTSNFQIGARTTNTGGLSAFANSKIDEFALWNTALSSDAVQEIYNATANNTGKVLDLTQDSGNYNASSNLQYFNRLGD